MQLPKLSFIQLPSKRKFEAKPCDCEERKGKPVNHGPHFREVKDED